MAQTSKLYNIKTHETLLDSRLWMGVPQLTADKLKHFDPAFSGQTFLFVVDVPKFMYDGPADPVRDELHAHIKNLKAAIERASIGFSGQNSMNVNFGEQNDGAGRKISHATSVVKEIDEISLRLHEFRGLVIKNALEKWVTGIYDVRSQRGNYHGRISDTLEWSLRNHSMQILVVQTDPSWTYIQDAAYYYNMVPTEVPFQYFDWTKGEHNIIEALDLRFRCNEERGPAIMHAAQKYMDNRVLNLVNTAVYDYNRFAPRDFHESGKNSGHIAQVDSDTHRVVDSPNGKVIQ